MATQSETISRKTRILDAAEILFSRRGFDGVTLRQITKAADVDVALANYHFGPKRELFKAVMERRSDHMNAIRNQALDTCLMEAGTKGPTIDAVIGAYLRPMAELQVSADEGWQHYLALVARVNNSHEWGGEMMSRHFNPFVRRFIDVLRIAVPDADDDALYWGYHYLSGALTLTFANTGRLDKLSDGKASSADYETGYAHMIPFLASGFKAICSPKS